MLRSRTRSLRRTSAPVVRRKPRQPRAIVTIDAILISVERILDTHGPAGLTTNRVAEIAGVSIGSLYQYYPNKQALIAAVQERVLDELYESVDIVLTSSGERALAEIVELVARGMLDVYSGRRSVYRWLIELRSEAAYQDRFQARVDQFVARVERFVASRSELAGDARAMAFVLVTAVEGIANAIAARPGQVNVPAIASAAIAMVAKSTR